MQRAIWWVRRDLRLSNNQALSTALEESAEVIPLFILDPGLLSSRYVGEKRLSFLWGGLRELDKALKELGSYLVIRRGNPLTELERMLQETQAQAIYAEADYSPYALQRDTVISRKLPVIWAGSTAVRPPGTVLRGDGRPYTVFTPFSKAWRSLPGLTDEAYLHRPQHIQTPTTISTVPLPVPGDISVLQMFPPGESEAQARLDRFVSFPFQNGNYSAAALPALCQYANHRDFLDHPGTSQLSPYLRFGMLSAPQAANAALRVIREFGDAEGCEGAKIWLNQLIWRDFYIHILYHFPQVRRQNFRLPDIRWSNDRQLFNAWCEGLTGYPIVDAAMRQLQQSGWMHNRARMIVASFLTKDLLIDWRWGEEWFMRHLIDGDPAANNGSWQWSAGTGTDAAPYFRIFNPTTQGLRYDPQGSYVRRWLPELANLPAEVIHTPWRLSKQEQHKFGCVIGKDYPAPIIDHDQARQKALLAYRQK